jgi:hypothetical protein
MVYIGSSGRRARQDVGSALKRERKLGSTKGEEIAASM